MRSYRARWLLFLAVILGCGGSDSGVQSPPPQNIVANKIEKVAGDAQTAMVASAVATAPSVKATSAAGQSVAGVPVMFSITSGGGSTSGATPITDASGIATVGRWTLGTAGSNTLTATATGLPPVTFTATAVTLAYDGPLVETHAHIVNYRSLLTNEGVNYRVDAREGATQRTAAMYVEGLSQNNIKCVVGFHAIALDSRRDELLSHARRLRTLYPNRFMLLAEIFSNNPLEWFDATRIDPFFDDDLFRGFGEIQFVNEPLGDGQAPRIHPNNARFLDIYERLGNRRLVVMSHPASPIGVPQAVARSGQLTWLMHGPQVHRRWTDMNNLETLLNTNPNLYYTVDFSESLPEFLEITKVHQDPTGADAFIQALNQNYSVYLDRMVTVWKDMIERHPDRFMWGTDMALPTWHWEPRVLDMIVRFSRDFIGRLSPTAAENFAYRNADRAFGSCR